MANTKIPVELSSTPGIVDNSNATAITIDSSENVGIGGSPDTQLNIKNGDDAVVRIESIGSESGDDARLEIKTTNGTFTIQNDRSLGTSGALTFAGNTSNNIVIDHNSGNVGIGTSSPAKPLDVQSGTANSNIAHFTGSNSTRGMTIATYNADSFDDAGVDLYGLRELRFSTNVAEAMRIDSSGNVGIGISSPQTNLDILGDNVDDSSPTLRLTNSLNTGSWESISGDLGRLEFFTQDTSANAPYVIGRITCNNDALSGSRTLPSGALKFFTRGYNASSLTLAMTLSSGGALSKASGSFKIDHPLESKKDTHHLVHSFVEAPQADNIYRGVVTLVDGSATINLDTEAGMTEGTFVLLNTNTSCFTSNESDWDAVKGSVSGNILTISCQNTSSTATVSWLVIGERHDQHMIDTDWTDENGKVIVEPLKGETE